MTAPDSSPSLSQRINSATRPLHTQLNFLITSLLPRALPPHTNDPTLYAEGISHILPIYEAFEGPFRLLLARVENEREDEQTPLKQALKNLHIPALERSQRLRNDLEKLRRAPPQELGLWRNKHPCQENKNDTLPPKLTAFTTHITTTTTTTPHLLLASTWLLYMALFSGGRHIRSKLRHAGPSFWLTSDINDVLSFWTFEGEDDGEDIKKEFKRMFAEVEGFLTEGEKEEVVGEGVRIMDGFGGVVGEIWGVVGEAKGGTGGGVWGYEISLPKGEEVGMRWLLLKHILPMGMVELMIGAADAVKTAMNWKIVGTAGADAR